MVNLSSDKKPTITTQEVKVVNKKENKQQTFKPIERIEEYYTAGNSQERIITDARFIQFSCESGLTLDIIIDGITIKSSYYQRPLLLSGTYPPISIIDQKSDRVITIYYY